ncbi:MAG: SusC/RagA family TonB-linked outer membrane protein, partial [Odoribacter sp.]|nr:SusC/RagA family TonB-linked outer membrane protein [Odoribacter sp.]
MVLVPNTGAFASVLPSSDHVLKGKVVDTKGLAIPGANVVIDGTMRGVSTLNDGTFTLPVTESTGFIRVTSVGFLPRRIEYNVNTDLIIRLEDEISELDEVRVIAYGEQNKRESVGSQSSIKADDIKDIPSPSLANLLQGKISGMNVVNMSGSPGGGGIAMIIRGYNSLSSEPGRRLSDPAIIVDGVRINTGMSEETGLDFLAEIDPNDIEDIQILKDASSASIYGSEAANGVILITTKKERLNQKPQITASYSQTVSLKPRFNDLMGGNRERWLRIQALENYQSPYYDAELGTYVYAESLWDAYKNSAHYTYFWNMGNGADIPMLQDSLNSFYNNSTNLFDYYFKTAKVSDVNLQISGGAENVAYFIGLGYYNEKGILRNTGFNRMKVLTNLQIKPYENVESNIRFYLARTSRDRSGKGKDRFNYTYDDILETIPSELLTTSTLLPGPGTPAFDAMIESYENTIEENESYRFRGSYDLSYEFIKGLKLKSSISADYSQTNQRLFMPSSMDSDGDTYSSAQIGRNLIWTNENLLTYRKEVFEHTFDALLGLSLQAEIKNNLSGFGRRAASDLIEYVSWNGNVYDSDLSKNLKDFMSDYTKSTMTSYFGRLNYNYKKKYLASFTLRWDGSSKFGENNKWAMFPAIGVEYAFSEESFMDWSKDFFNYGKLRFSWGKSGKQFESPYLAFGVLEQHSNTFLGNPIVQPEWFYGLINRNLTWEETLQYDVGLDLDFFDYRLGIVIDYYNRYTDKLLYRVPLPSNFSGYEYQWQNAYGIRNSGVEFKVDWDIFRREDFTWSFTFNLAKNWNMLKKSNNSMDLQNT